MGKLIYLSHTRPNIAYLVSVVSQLMHDPQERHLQAVDRILQYLKMSPGRGLLFKKSEQMSMEVYTNADYAGSTVDRILYVPRWKFSDMEEQETKCSCQIKCRGRV